MLVLAWNALGEELVAKQMAAREVVCGCFEAGAQAVLVGQHGDGADPEGQVFDALDDGVAHVGDQDGERRHGEQAPEDEERLAGVGLWREVPVPDCEQGGV